MFHVAWITFHFPSPDMGVQQKYGKFHIFALLNQAQAPAGRGLALFPIYPAT